MYAQGYEILRLKMQRGKKYHHVIALGTSPLKVSLTFHHSLVIYFVPIKVSGLFILLGVVNKGSLWMYIKK